MRSLVAIAFLGISFFSMTAAAQQRAAECERLLSKIKTGDAKERREALALLPREVKTADDAVRAIAAVGELIYRDPDPTIRLKAYQCMTWLQNHARESLFEDVRAGLAKPGTEEETLAAEVAMSGGQFERLLPELLSVQGYFGFKKAERPLPDRVRRFIRNQPVESYSSILRSRDTKVRMAALDGLASHLSIAGNSAMDGYLAESWNDSPAERILVLRIIGKMYAPEGKPLDYVLRALQDADRDVQFAAVWTLSHWGGITMPHLLRIARQEGLPLRAGALYGLGSNCPPTEECIATLIEGLNSGDQSVVIAAAHSLGRHGDNAAAAVPALAPRLRACGDSSDTHGYACTAALVDALGKMGPAALQADAELRRLVLRTAPLRHTQIAQTLAKIHGDPAAGAPLLQATLDYAAEACDDEVMRLALPAAAEIPLELDPYIQSITKYLEKAHQLRKQKAKRWDYPQMYAMWQSVEALQKMGPKAAMAEPILREIAADTTYRDRSLQKHIRDARISIGTLPKSAPARRD